MADLAVTAPVPQPTAPLTTLMNTAKPHPRVYKISQSPERIKTKMNLYGKSGTGKTWMMADIAKHFRTLMISSEFSQVTIQKHNNFALIDPNLEIFDVDSWDSMREAFDFLLENQAKYEWVLIDSLTDINKRAIEDIASSTKDEAMSMRQWGQVSQRIEKLIRYIRDLRINVGFSTLATSEKNDMTGEVCMYPSLTGRLKEEFPAYLDINGYVFTKESQTEPGKVDRMIQFVNSPKAIAKDRHNTFANFEFADMTTLLRKMKMIT